MVLTFFGIAGKRLWFGSDSKLFFFGMVTVLTFVGIDSFSGFESKGYGGFDSNLVSTLLKSSLPKFFIVTNQF